MNLKNLSISLVLLGISNTAYAQIFPEKTIVEFNTIDSPNEYIKTVNQAVWGWNNRIGELLVNNGATMLAPLPTSGKIVVQFKDFAWFLLNGQSIHSLGSATRYVYLDSGVFAGATITINKDLYTPNCATHVLTHEIGHVMTKGPMIHSGYPHDVMYAYNASCRGALSYNDIILIGYKVKNCNAEILENENLYIPYINGYGVSLELVGPYTWKLGDSTDVIGNFCNTNRLDSNNDLYLNADSKDFSVDAKLKWIGSDTWVLERATLK